MEYRMEHDALGEVPVPADKLWGAQTQRSFQNFRIGHDRMPEQVIFAFAVLKKRRRLPTGSLASWTRHAAKSSAMYVMKFWPESFRRNSRFSSGRRAPVRSRT